MEKASWEEWLASQATYWSVKSEALFECLRSSLFKRLTIGLTFDEDRQLGVQHNERIVDLIS